MFHILAVANLTRQKLRSLVTAGGVAIAVGALFLLLLFQKGYQRGMNAELDRLGAHLIVVPKGCPYDAASIALHGASWPCYLKEEYLRSVEAEKRVATAAPVLMSAVYDPATGGQSVYCGVDRRILALRPHWRFAAGGFPEKAGELLVGASLARSRGWRVGSRVALPGVEGEQGVVAGILEVTGGADDLFVYLPLRDAQRIFHRPAALTHVLVKLHDADDAEAVAKSLRGCEAGLEMTVVPLAHLFATIQGLVRATRLLLGCIGLVALLAAGAGVTNTILMAVSERTREIGVLRALGASPATIFGMIWLETLVLCVLGGAAGIALALVGASWAESLLRARLPFSPTDRLGGVDLPLILGCLAIGPVLGALAALPPAARAARLSPSLAIREGA